MTGLRSVIALIATVGLAAVLGCVAPPVQPVPVSISALEGRWYQELPKGQLGREQRTLELESRGVGSTFVSLSDPGTPGMSEPDNFTFTLEGARLVFVFDDGHRETLVVTGMSDNSFESSVNATATVLIGGSWKRRE